MHPDSSVRRRSGVRRWLWLALSVAALAACATVAGHDDVRESAIALMKSSFAPKGQATMDRLDQDEVQRTCSMYAGKAPPADIAARLEKAQLATIKYPTDGKLLGDWRSGEKIAQQGVGLQFSDPPGSPAGGNCYACHQLTRAEISFGTIGPSLYNFGKTHGYGEEMQKYVYAKVYNSEAFNACSNMPRFGYKGILSEQQIKDVAALLLDPASPVNQ
jgi:L-cysteine S-thiosulfotransferase